MLTKFCTKCKRELPATKEYFHRKCTSKDGFLSNCKICRRGFYENHREQIKAYREIHKEEKKIYQKIYRENHREQIRAHRETHKEQRNNYSKLYYMNHKKEMNIKHTLYYISHKKEYKEMKYRRRAREQVTLNINFSLNGWLNIQSKPLHCYLCGKLIRKNQKYHIDHRIPLSRGGSHVPWNLGLTHDKCNFSKHTKTPWEYAPQRFQPELPL